MTEGPGTGIPLPRGATGFLRPGDAPLPHTSLRAFRAAVYTAARLAGGRVGEVREQVYPSTFHTASVLDGTGETVVLCHAHHPWVAFARETRTWHDGEFLAPPPWASAFALTGFEVLGLDRLTTPLSAVDTSALSRDERRQVRVYGITALGGLLFNAWD
ncbi:hypothetical protein [Streptomyces griseosporeus]|uniref:hypothetical protein n=1 Tax=Streptomyces griseosporeus TaxID=1910 RepID=UPI00167EF8AB|nr:hypothetical protein [Streptomyces griseosporeus]GHF52710.1 hypothetical protein GCM10018783_21920 [Streptomyces griseosporeus]